MDKRKAEMFLSSILIVLSVFILTSNNLVEGGVETDLGSLFLPRSVALIMIALSIMMGWPAVKSFMKKHPINKDELIATEGFSGVLLYMIAMVGYWLAMPYVGFMFSTVAVMVFVAYVFGCSSLQDWFKVVLMALVIAIGIDYGTKHFLRVYLPSFELF